MPNDKAAEAFAGYFAERWQTVEGAADHMSLPEGTVFFADVSGDGAPELYLTYSTGGGKQTGLLAYDVSGGTPRELGMAYLAVAPVGNALEFSLWGEGQERVLYTKGELPVGAANTVRYFTESFLTFSEGRLAATELDYSVDGPQETYYDGSPTGTQVSKEQYERLRAEKLGTQEALETVPQSEPFEFFENDAALAEQVRKALEQWRQNHG